MGKLVPVTDVLKILDELAERFDPDVLAQGDIAALATDAIMALADTTEQPEAEIERLRARLDWSPECPEQDGIYWRDETIRLQDVELKKLREKVKNLDNTLDFERGSLRRAFQLVDSLRAEVEALRRDAERWRWLKSQAVWAPGSGNRVTWDVRMPDPDIRAGVLTETSVGEELDAAIDAAISEQALQALADEAQSDGEYDVPGDEKR